MNTNLTLSEIREQGIGNGFTVLNPADGFRKDNTLWFGNCANCGERVTQSRFDKFWSHTVPAKGISGDWQATREVDYCPSV
jgi:hypothetical protein